jgi:phage portal protein BeeE
MARNFIERLTDAVTQLREPLPSKMLGDIETKASAAVEARPDFGRGYNAPYLDSVYSRFWDTSRTVNYRHELGRLDNSSLVMSVCNWTGINLAEALPVVTTPDKKGVPQIELQHAASDLIRRPNPFHIWADYCLVGAFSWWMGNWYMKKVRDVSGQVVELWYIPHFLIEPRWPSDGRSPQVPENEVEPGNTFLTHYQYNIPGRSPQLIKKADMVHIKRGVNVDYPRVGVGVWDGVLQELYGHDAVNRFSATILKNMGKVGYFLSPKEQPGPNATEARAIEEQFVLKSTGENANKPMVSSGAFDVTRLGWSPEELDLSELDKMPQAAIAGVTGIPAIVLQFPIGLEHGHYGAAYEQARQQGYENVIIPTQNHISEDLTWQVLPELDNRKGARLTFDISKVRVLQEDRDALYKRESESLRSGGITIDQYLQSLGKDPLGSPLGDVRFIPSTSTPMSPGRLTATAADMTPKPEPQPVDPASLAKFADIDRWKDWMEDQMKGFEIPK